MVGDTASVPTIPVLSAKVQFNVYLPGTLVRRVKHEAVEQALSEYLRAHGETHEEAHG